MLSPSMCSDMKTDLEVMRKRFRSFMILNLYVNSADKDLKDIYIGNAIVHNNQMLTNPFPDSGFDVMSPDFITARNENVNKIDFSIRCSATLENADGSSEPTGYYMYPRSSVSKTPLRLANSVGIIDSGYRGNLMGMFDCLYQTSYKLEKFQRICQICAPTMIPIYVNVVPEESDLGISTSRGTGGFGSTGK